LEKCGIEHKDVPSKELDITDSTAVLSMLSDYHPNAVIHCAAYTAVDKAEDELEKCFAVNEDGMRNIAEACKAIGAKLLYLSTDYVFPGMGEQFYETDAPTGALSVYGKSKLAGETVIRETIGLYFIVRTSWAFGVNGSNFVKTMLRLSVTHDTLTVVNDQIGSPTYTADPAPLLCDMNATEKYGVYHATNEGICSWAEFAREIFLQTGKDVKVIPVTTVEYGAKAVRPANSRMSKTALDKAGFSRLPVWRDALKRYLWELS
jgi:dTDP-4-dehydrorhamnose reductase